MINKPLPNNEECSDEQLAAQQMEEQMDSKIEEANLELQEYYESEQYVRDEEQFYENSNISNRGNKCFFNG